MTIYRENAFKRLCRGGRGQAKVGAMVCISKTALCPVGMRCLESWGSPEHGWQEKTRPRMKCSMGSLPAPV